MIPPPLPSRFSDGEYRRRWDAVRELMTGQGLEALVAFGARGTAHEVLYLSGYPVSGEAALVLPLEGSATLLVHYENHVPDARRLSVVEDVRPRGEDVAAAVVGCLREKGTRGRIGLAGPLSFQRHAALAASRGSGSLVDVSRHFARLRLRKSEEEIAFIRRGAALSDAAVRALQAQARPGLTEHDLAAIVEAAYLPLGGTTHIRFIGVTSMTRPSLCVPSQWPSDRELGAGDVILTEISAAWGGYYGQVLRTLTVAADPTPAYSRLHEVAGKVYTEICDRIRPGARSEAVLDAAELIHDAGFSIYDDLVHCAVGGVYAPCLRTRRTTRGPGHSFTFEEDMVIVVQPNVITPDERMGVQVGEMLRVTAGGTESLHALPREILPCG